MLTSWTWGSWGGGSRSLVGNSPAAVLCSTVLPLLVSFSGCGDESSVGVLDSGPASSLSDAASSLSEGDATSLSPEASIGVDDPDTGVTNDGSQSEASAFSPEASIIANEPEASVTIDPTPVEASVDASIGDIDPNDTNCFLGSVGCAEGSAYECAEGLDENVWDARADMQCPMWPARACSRAIKLLRAQTQPCNTNSDCILWGGMSTDYACMGSNGDPTLSISRLVSDELRDGWNDDYQALVAGGCREEFYAD
jgi:hypothetical protein